MPKRKMWIPNRMIRAKLTPLFWGWRITRRLDFCYIWATFRASARARSTSRASSRNTSKSWTWTNSRTRNYYLRRIMSGAGLELSNPVLEIGNVELTAEAYWYFDPVKKVSVEIRLVEATVVVISSDDTTDFIGTVLYDCEETCLERW